MSTPAKPRSKLKFDGPLVVVTPEYLGRWIAWTLDEGRIVADGATLRACAASAARAGFARDKVVFDKIRPPRHRRPGPV